MTSIGMGRIRSFFTEWAARRDGHRALSREHSVARAARDVTGVAGIGTTRAWDELVEHSEAYLKSFDPKVPPSLHISARDRTRHNQAIPIQERILGDFNGTKDDDDIPVEDRAPTDLSELTDLD